MGGLINGYDRVAIVESSWDGRDLFSIKGLPGTILVTERTKELCGELRLAVCGLIPAEDYSNPLPLKFWEQKDWRG